jgi:hypothetical protein
MMRVLSVLLILLLCNVFHSQTHYDSNTVFGGVVNAFTILPNSCPVTKTKTTSNSIIIFRRTATITTTTTTTTTTIRKTKCIPLNMMNIFNTNPFTSLIKKATTGGTSTLQSPGIDIEKQVNVQNTNKIKPKFHTTHSLIFCSILLLLTIFFYFFALTKQ